VPRIRASLVLLAILAAAPLLTGASRTDTLTVSATVSARAKLQLSSLSMSFADADPDTTPSVPASGGPLTIQAKGRTTIGSTVTLVMLATGDLQSGLDVIPADRLSWTATGAGFVGGTVSTAMAQAVGSWANSGSWTGTQSYQFANAWNYSTGTYTTTLTYTLTAP